MKEKLYLGISKKDITPKIGAPLYGYVPDLFSESVNDNLTLQTFCFKYGKTKALMISISVCLLKTDLAKELRMEIAEKYGFDYGSIILSVTHTHTGPCTADEKGWGDADMEYYNEILKPALLESVEEATRNMEEVTVSVKTGESLVGVNRRELSKDNKINLGQCPWGAFDSKMTVISFKNAKDEIVGNIIHYGCHGTAAGRIKIISRDWAGIMTDSLDAKTGGITAFFNGPEGDVGPRLSNGDTAGNGMEYVYEMGEIAAKDALAIYDKEGEYIDADLMVKSGTIKLPLKPRVSYEEAIKGIAEFNGSKINISGMAFEHFKDVKESYDNGYEEMKAKEIEQTIIKIGDAVFVSFPYELFSEIGMRINRAVAGLHILSLSNANGSEGYFPTEDQLCRGGYEIGMFKYANVQPFADDADFHIVKETLQNLEDIIK